VTDAPRVHAAHDTFYTYLDTPAGRLLLAGCEDHGLRFISFQRGTGTLAPEPHWRHSPTSLVTVVRQLQEYFDGQRTAFDLKLHPKGTEFQKAVWTTLLTIPYGTTCTYGDLARLIGRPSAVRAVGLANGQNPLPIVIPCHRVIGKDGTLTGYGGGLDVKRLLLDLERGRSRLDFGDRQ
jgi:methylated-DNA-[protein]-cysteine S-methyltransferase